MTKHSRPIFLSSMLLFMLLFSLARPTAAYADDGAPPPPATEEPVQPPSVDLPDEVSPPTGDGPEEPAVMQDATVAEVLAAAPEGTEVIVLNEEGSPEPLVTQRAVEIVQGGDPRYTVAGVTYYFMPVDGCGVLLNCTESDTPIQTAIDYLSGTGATPDDGTIYVEAGTYAEDVIIDGTSWSEGNTPAMLNLLGAGSGMTTLNGSIFITNMNTFTLSGFTVEAGNSENPAGIFAIGNTGTLTLFDVNVTNSAGDGIDIVMHDGDVKMAHVTANGNAGSGLGNLIMGAEGANGASLFYVSGKANIQDSNFNQNTGAGLLVFLSFNDITLSNVTANNNASYGALLMNEPIFEGNTAIASESDGTIASVTTSITNSHFDGNTTGFGEFEEEFFPPAGLLVFTDGDVKLDTVSASNNPNGYGSIIVSSSNLVVKDSTFDKNGEDGALLEIDEDGAIICSKFNGNLGIGVDGYEVGGIFTLDRVTFNDNGGGDYDGTPVILSGGCTMVKDKEHTSRSTLPLHIVPVGGGEQIDLDCGAYSGTRLVLPNGDQVTLPCPIKNHGVLTNKTAEQLPAPLNSPFGFASGLEIQVIRNGESLDKTNVGMTIDFVIPDGMQDAEFAILRWDEDGAQWVEVPGGYRTGDSRFLVNSKFTGVYVLVTK